MRTPVKPLIIAALVLIALPLVAWTGTFLYWDIKIRRVLQSLEARSTGRRMWLDHDEEFTAMTKSGCRVLPYLVRAMENPASGEFHWGVLDSLIAWGYKLHDPSFPDEPRLSDINVLNVNRIRFDDSPEVRRAKVVRIRDWWDAEGHRYHQWWRVWSANCHAAR